VTRVRERCFEYLDRYVDAELGHELALAQRER
jgi:hypothetical protein